MHIELARAEAPLLPPQWIVVVEDEMLFGPDTLRNCRDFILATRDRLADGEQPGVPPPPYRTNSSWRPD